MTIQVICFQQQGVSRIIYWSVLSFPCHCNLTYIRACRRCGHLNFYITSYSTPQGTSQSWYLCFYLSLCKREEKKSTVPHLSHHETRSCHSECGWSPAGRRPPPQHCPQHAAAALSTCEPRTCRAHSNNCQVIKDHVKKSFL